MNTEPRTLFEKVWQQHVVVEPQGEPTLLYIDLQTAARGHLAAGLEGLRLAGRTVRASTAASPPSTTTATNHRGRLNIVDQTPPYRSPRCARTALSRHELYDVDSRDQALRTSSALSWALPAGNDYRLRRTSHTSNHGAFARSRSASAPAKWSTCCHADAAAIQAQNLPHLRRGRAATRRHGQRHYSPPSTGRSVPTARPLASSNTQGSHRALSMEGRMTVCI